MTVATWKTKKEMENAMIYIRWWRLEVDKLSQDYT
jgi:hypothetical protein